MLDGLDVRTPLDDVYETPSLRISNFDMAEDRFCVIVVMLYQVQKVHNCFHRICHFPDDLAASDCFRDFHSRSVDTIDNPSFDVHGLDMSDEAILKAVGHVPYVG
jgi:hypothetical protein